MTASESRGGAGGAERSARLDDAIAQAEAADRPHRASTMGVFSVDVRVEYHVDILVRHVDCGRAAGPCGLELAAIFAEERTTG